jgi:hypothetical protein
LRYAALSIPVIPAPIQRIDEALYILLATSAISFFLSSKD